MTLRLTATLVKQYFQYRCERQIRYAMLSDEERLALAIIDQPEGRSPWAQAGVDFERDVLTTLCRREPVLAPPPGQHALDEDRTAAFLRGRRPEGVAYQACLRLARPDEFRRRWSVPPRVDLSAGLPDLVRIIRADGRILFRLIDIKAVQVPAPFHKIQVAFSSLLLEAILHEAGLPHAIDPVAQIWHPAPDHVPGQARWTEVDFRLGGYRARFRCLGPLTLVGQEDSPRFQGGRRLRFVGPREGRYSEIGEGTYGVILTPDDPDLLLDPDAWDELGVTVRRLAAFQDRVEVTLDVWKDVWEAGRLAGLLAAGPAARWALDLRFTDHNTPRLIQFLEYVGTGASDERGSRRPFLPVLAAELCRLAAAGAGRTLGRAGPAGQPPTPRGAARRRGGVRVRHATPRVYHQLRPDHPYRGIRPRRPGVRR